MKHRAPPFFIAGAAALASSLALAACDRPADSPQPEETPLDAEPLTDPAVEEQPVASIIRPDVAPAPVVDLPPEPLEVTIPFPEGSALTEAAERRLAAMLESEALAEGWPIVLRGHSDAAGSDSANLRVSQRRAEAVADWLTEHGVDEERIRIIAFGEQNPAAPNANPEGEPDEAGRASNRRVEIIIAPPDGAPTAAEAIAEQAGAAIGDAAERMGVEPR